MYNITWVLPRRGFITGAVIWIYRNELKKGTAHFTLNKWAAQKDKGHSVIKMVSSMIKKKKKKNV